MTLIFPSLYVLVSILCLYQQIFSTLRQLNRKGTQVCLHTTLLESCRGKLSLQRCLIVNFTFARLKQIKKYHISILRRFILSLFSNSSLWNIKIEEFIAPPTNAFLMSNLAGLVSGRLGCCGNLFLLHLLGKELEMHQATLQNRTYNLIKLMNLNRSSTSSTPGRGMDS